MYEKIFLFYSFFVFTLELKDKVNPGFIVKTDNIHYTLTNDIEYDANTSDSLLGKEVTNPETMDKIFILFMILLGAIGVTFVFVFQLLMKRLVLTNLFCILENN